jgi:hypothetical protein
MYGWCGLELVAWVSEASLALRLRKGSAFSNNLSVDSMVLIQMIVVWYPLQHFGLVEYADLLVMGRCTLVERVQGEL